MYAFSSSFHWSVLPTVTRLPGVDQSCSSVALSLPVEQCWQFIAICPQSDCHPPAGQADLQRANQKVDRLQQLARTLQKENKLMADEVEMRRQQIDGFKKTTQVIASSVPELS